MQKEWIIKPEVDSDTIKELADKINVSYPIGSLLSQRGITDYNQAKRFFRPQIEHLHDPFLMKDMQIATDRIQMAINNKEKVLVYGDYDVDGTTSVAMMYTFLKDKIQDLYYYIPDRYSEGYGISFKGIDYAHEKECSLIISLDCGIKAIDKVDYASDKNIDFIIVDHHEPDEELPLAVAVLDPKRPDCQYPFKELSACGVGFKLIQAVSKQMDIPFHEIEGFLDLVVVSIASDIVPIIDENRTLAHFGLKQINTKPRMGLKAIINVAGAQLGNLKITELVFKIGPRINAAGRMEQGRYAVDILVSTDEAKLPEMADQIDTDNTERKWYDSNITKEALEMLEKNTELANKKSTVLYSPEWHKGVIGIVASRVIDHYFKPTIILTKSNGFITGSARSVKGFNIYKAIEKCQHLLVSFGGHMYAAGLTFKEENLNEFINLFETTVKSQITPDSEVPTIEVDAIISINDIKPKFFNLLKQFEPFGPENMSPIFVTNEVVDTGYGQTVGADNEHLKLYIKDKSTNRSISAIAFRQACHYERISNNNKFNICYSIEENNYKGKTSIQLKVRDIKK